jgi:hypothetical protein
MEERIKELKKQQEAARELYIKCQGAIEVLESIAKEEKDGKEKDNKKV